jgi:phosphate acetyltransferase
MHPLLETIHRNAQNHYKRIVLPESLEPRTMKAADYALANNLAEIILIGEHDNIFRKAQELGLQNIGNATIINPKTYEKRHAFIEEMLTMRAGKGLTREEAEKQLDNPLYFAVMLIKCKDADGEVAGADNATANVLRPAFQYIKTAPNMSVVSGAFIMLLPDHEFGDNGTMVFADCAVHPEPNDKQLAEIAVATAKTASDIANIEPRVALLSFSTKGSAQHPMVDKVVSAVKLAQTTAPQFQFDGELQADAAIIPAIGQKKAPESTIAGHANVLVFPDLQSGNIAYKLVQRLAHAEAIGPILQGLAAPINDLSRGCSVDDIINMIAITANQAAGL